MIENLYDVKDKVAIVTGSSRGIGKQCALAFAEAGAKLVLNYVSNQEAAEITAEEVAAVGSEAIIVQADVKDFEACQTLGEEAIKLYGKVDFLVNNAGINRDITFSRMSLEELWTEEGLFMFSLIRLSPVFAARENILRYRFFSLQLQIWSVLKKLNQVLLLGF